MKGEDNVIAYNSSFGVDISGSSGNWVAGNDVYANQNHGVFLYSSYFNTVIGNVIGLDSSGIPAGNNGDGILVNGGSTT